MTASVPSSIPHDSEAAAEILIPLEGLPWGTRCIDPPAVDVRPMLCAAMEASDGNTLPAPVPVPRVVVLRRAYRGAFWQGFITGALWAVALAFAMGWIAGKVRGLAELAEPVPAVHAPAEPATSWDAKA